MTDEIKRVAEGLSEVEAAMAQLQESYAGAWQRLSDGLMANLLEQMKRNPKITIDDVLAYHKQMMDQLGDPAVIDRLATAIKGEHREFLDKLLDIENEHRKEG